MSTIRSEKSSAPVKGAAKAATRGRPAKLAVVPPAPRSPSVFDSPTPPPSAITLVRLGTITRAPENVRHIRPDEDVAPLADDIAAHGVLQSLIGYQADDRTWIVGGGRRLQALNLLADRGAVGLDFPVPVLLRDRDEAIELSLSENLAKRDMSPVDECRAFAALMERGTTSPHDLAKRFGFSDRYVRQRLRLADLAPEILDALAERKITLPSAEAYARSVDVHLQLDVFKAQEKTSWDAHQPHRIKAAYGDLQATTASPLFKFVGAEIYEREGGGYEDDLFTAGDAESQSRKLTHGHLLLTKAEEMLRFQAIRSEAGLKKELPGFAGFAVPPNARSGGYPWKAPAAPKGMVLLESDYYGFDRAKLWKNAKACSASTIVIIGVGASGELEIVRDKLFVDKAVVDRVEPKPKASGSSQPAETPEQREARFRENRIDELQWRLGVGPFAGTPLEGRAIWPHGYVREVERAHDPRFAGGRLVAVQVFVTDAEHAAMRAAAEKKLDEEDAEAAESEKRAAEDRAKREATIAELVAMDPPPAVITLDAEPFFRKPDGEWTDDPELIEAPDTLGMFPGIASLLEQASADEEIAHFATLEAFRDAHRAGETADA